MRLLAGAAALALAAPFPALAQDHGDHSAHGQPATQVDHSQMDHGETDHASMSHGGEGSGTSRLPANETMNHGAMIASTATPR